MQKRFRKIYLEISNLCNLQCTFCPEVEREKKITSPLDFESLLLKALPFADQICLHLMGEPLGHPEFDELLSIAYKHGAKINLTTNGTLIHRLNPERENFKCLEQINFSLQSWPDNFPQKNILQYLKPIFDFTRECNRLHPETYINYRLWNQGSEWSEEKILLAIEEEFAVCINRQIHVDWKKAKRMFGRVYMNFDSRFDWPSLSAPFVSTQGTCHALDHHIGIHANGTVVPCCLDKEAKMALGNLHEHSLIEILDSKLAGEIRAGFVQGEMHHPLCQHCQFATRFQKKAPKLKDNKLMTISQTV